MRLLDLLLPPACAGCGRAAGALLCADCRARLRPPSEPIDRFVVADAGVIVGEGLRLALAAYAYEGPMRRAIAALKYAGASRVAPVLADLVVPVLDRLIAISGPALLVPVPVHPERRAARGYNQAELIARALGTQRSMRVADCLQRVRPTTRQHRLDRAARLRNLQGAFVAADAGSETAILVDDIITTTATLQACAGALGAAGCRKVYGLAVAREV